MNHKWFFLLLVFFTGLVPCERAVAGGFAMSFGIGALSPTNSDNSTNLACAALFAFDVGTTEDLSFSIGSEVWAIFSSYQGGDLETVPILACVRTTLFPSSPVRLYGTAGAGVCIAKYTVTEWEMFLFIPVENSKEETSSAFAVAFGGGVEFMFGRNLLSLDYRYLSVPGDARLGGHLITLSYGFCF